jgi:hypothetical protein
VWRERAEETGVDQAIIDGNKASFDRIMALIGGRSDDELRTPMNDGWTVAAVLAHIAFWDRRVSRLLDRWVRDGVSPSPYDADAVNDAMKPAWLLIPPADARAEFVAAAKEADDYVATIDAEFLERINAAQSVAVNRARHRDTHYVDLAPLFT